MFILISIVINSSLTSKRTHVCSPTVIAMSLAVPEDSSSFFSVSSVRVSKCQREGEKIVPSILLSKCETNLSLQKDYFANPNGENMRKWVPKWCPKFTKIQQLISLGSQFYWDRFWVSVGKEKAQCEGHFFHHRYYLKNPKRWVCVKISSKSRVQIS